MEAFLKHLWPSTFVPHLTRVQLGRKYRLRQESKLCINGCVPSYRCLLHLPCCSNWKSVVTETFFKKERARYMGIWTLMVTLGVPIAPFIFGFVACHVGYRWIYWILAMVSVLSAQFIYVHSQMPRSTVANSFFTSSLVQRPGTSAAACSIKNPPSSKNT